MDSGSLLPQSTTASCLTPKKLAAHSGELPDGGAPDQTEERSAEYNPENLHSNAGPKFLQIQRSDQGLNREEERPFEGQVVGKVLYPLRHKGHGNETPRENQFETKIQF